MVDGVAHGTDPEQRELAQMFDGSETARRMRLERDAGEVEMAPVADDEMGTGILHAAGDRPDRIGEGGCGAIH
jgi:hypothetical protein